MSEYIVAQTEEYSEWFEKQPRKTQVIISKRIKNITTDGYLGDFKSVSKYDKGITKDCIFELRWDDGKRVYFGKIGNSYLLLLYGGNKNGQDKDIKDAKNIFVKNVEEIKNEEKRESIENKKRSKSKKV